MSDTLEQDDQVTPVRDLDSAAAYFDRLDAKKPANDSTATAAAGAATETDDEPDPNADPKNPDDKKEGDEDDPTKAPEFKELPEWARKRMGEISEKKNILNGEVETLKTETQSKDARIAELEQQVAGKAPVVVAAPPENPLANVEDPRQLHAELESALSIREWALANPEGGTIDYGDGKTREVSKEEVQAALANTDRMINQHIPARRDFIEKRGQYVEAARTDYPDLFKAGSEDHSTYQSLLSHWPEIKRFLDPEIIGGRYIRGLKAEQAERAAAKAKAEGKAPGTPAKKPATAIAPTALRQSTPGMPSGGVKNDAELAEAKKQATSTGTMDAAARYFDAMERRRS